MDNVCITALAFLLFVISIVYFHVIQMKLFFVTTTDVQNYTAQKINLSNAVCRIWSHLLKKSLMENFLFCTILV